MSRKAIVGGRVIDGTGSDPIEPGIVLVDEDNIERVGEAEAVPVPEDAEVIDAAGMTVMPGLIDVHMHVGFHFAAQKRLRDCLMRGGTTVAGQTSGPGGVALREAIEQGQVAGCSRYVVGAVVGCTNGHLKRTDGNVAGVTADGPWEVRKGVRQMVEADVDFIKTAASGGFQWAAEAMGWRNYTMEEFSALVDEAHAWDRRVAVHAHVQPGINNSIQVGCDAIHHGSYIDDEGLEGILAKNLFFVPTLYITSETSFSRESLSPWIAERTKAAHASHREGVRKAHEMGITIAVGTDGGPGDAAHEMMELVDCGLSPMEAIVAATRTSADALGILGKLGTLEPGKQADVIIVDGNPLDDISLPYQEEKVLMVMKDGKVEVTREAEG